MKYTLKQNNFIDKTKNVITKLYTKQWEILPVQILILYFCFNSKIKLHIFVNFRDSTGYIALYTEILCNNYSSTK